MGVLLLLWMLGSQEPEKHRGPSPSSEFPIVVVQDGPLTIPANIFWKAFAGLLGFNVLGIGGVAKYLWKKHNEEVAAINAKVNGTVLYDTYSRDKRETRQLIAALGDKMAHQHEMLAAKVDRHHEVMMAQLLQLTRDHADRE